MSRWAVRAVTVAEEEEQKQQSCRKQWSSREMSGRTSIAAGSAQTASREKGAYCMAGARRDREMLQTEEASRAQGTMAVDKAGGSGGLKGEQLSNAGCRTLLWSGLVCRGIKRSCACSGCRIQQQEHSTAQHNAGSTRN